MTDAYRESQPEQDLDSDRMVETTESLRDDDPEVMPMDRGIEATDRPLGAEKFGTTHAEAVQGESLDDRLAQEVPDSGEHDPVEEIVSADPQTFAPDEVQSGQTDEQVLGDAYGPPDSGDDGAPVGRIVEPDEGAHTDTEKDVIAADVGRDGGGTSAEETALHVEEEW